MVCPKTHDFWPRTNILREKNKKIPSMDDGLSKSAKIILSKSILDVKNLSKNFNLGDHYLLKLFFF